MREKNAAVTTVEALERCLSAYYFQEGSRANKRVIRRMEKLIKKVKRDEQQKTA